MNWYNTFYKTSNEIRSILCKLVTISKFWMPWISFQWLACLTITYKTHKGIMCCKYNSFDMKACAAGLGKTLHVTLHNCIFIQFEIHCLHYEIARVTFVPIKKKSTAWTKEYVPLPTQAWRYFWWHFKHCGSGGTY